MISFCEPTVRFAAGFLMRVGLLAKKFFLRLFLTLDNFALSVHYGSGTLPLMNSKTRLNWVAGLLLASHAAISLASLPNTLTDAERQAGWKLLFDGKTTSG